MESTNEQVYKNWTETLAYWIAIMFNVGKEVAGETFVQRLEEEFYQGGARQGRRLSSLLGVTGTDCTAIGTVLDAVDESFGNYWDGYVENSTEAFEKRITTCPVAKPFSRAPEICSRLIAAGGRGIAASINPDTDFRFSELISKGDETCHYRVETR